MTSGQPRIRVLVVEDHPMTRAGLELFLRAYPDIDLIGQVSSGEEALQFCEEDVPDVVLMDIKLPGIDGVEATALLRKRHPRVQIIALSSYQDRDLIERVVQAGAISYLLKTATAQELIHAIQAAYAGWSVLSPEAADAPCSLCASNRSGRTSRSGSRKYWYSWRKGLPTLTSPNVSE